MARGKRSTGSKDSMRVFYGVLAVVAVAGLAILVYTIMSGGGGDAAVEPLELTELEDPQALVEKAEGVTIGDPSAPVRILEFGDYQCPACGNFARMVKPQLIQNEIEEGRVQFTFYDFPLSGHQHSFIAARAARCAGAQDRFWDYHDLLFGRQSDWSYQDEVVDDFTAYAGQLGLDAAAFESCLESDRYADVVTANLMLGQRLGVRATPWVIVNGRRVEQWSYENLREVIRSGTGT